MTSFVSLYSDLTRELSEERQMHCAAVGCKVAAVADLVSPALRADVVTAAILHDIGYAHRDLGFHAIDGARFLASRGFSAVVVELVARHSASEVEADVRGISRTIFDKFKAKGDLDAAHSAIAWADMTTSPTGETVTVEERLDEIQSRYGPESLVTTFIDRARPRLLAAGQSPTGSMRV